MRDDVYEAWRLVKPGRYMAVVFCNRGWRVRVRAQGTLRADDVTPLLVLAAILDMGHRSVTWQNSSSSVVIVDQILTVRKSGRR